MPVNIGKLWDGMPTSTQLEVLLRAGFSETDTQTIAGIPWYWLRADVKKRIKGVKR